MEYYYLVGCPGTKESAETSEAWMALLMKQTNVLATRRCRGREMTATRDKIFTNKET